MTPEEALIEEESRMHALAISSPHYAQHVREENMANAAVNAFKNNFIQKHGGLLNRVSEKNDGCLDAAIADIQPKS